MSRRLSCNAFLSHLKTDPTSKQSHRSLSSVKQCKLDLFVIDSNAMREEKVERLCVYVYVCGALVVCVDCYLLIE